MPRSRTRVGWCDSVPQVVLFATNLYESFVQKVFIAEASVSAPKAFGKFRAELVDPKVEWLRN